MMVSMCSTLRTSSSHTTKDRWVIYFHALVCLLFPHAGLLTRSLSFKFLDLPDKSNNTPRIDPAINVMNLAVTAASGETKKSIYWLAGLYARLMIYGNWFFICTKSLYNKTIIVYRYK